MVPMREFHDRLGRDGADVGTDSSGSGRARTPQPRHEQGVLDAAARTAYALEYRQRVEAACSASAARQPTPQDAGAAPQLSRADRAERMSREVELPASAQARPEAREVLPNLRLAEVDPRKLSEYSLNPGHPQNGGKAEGWRALGYDVDNPKARSEAAEDVRELIRDGLLACGRVTETRDTPFGSAYKVLNGFSGPNGRHATLVTCWLVEDPSGRGFPKLTTVWVQPHRDRETAQ
jgi:hypothetical protein